MAQKSRSYTYDQDKVKELRMKLIFAGIDILNGSSEVEKWSQLKKDFVLKAAVRALPILNAGRDDDSDLVPNPLLMGKSNGDNNSDKKAPRAEEENS